MSSVTRYPNRVAVVLAALACWLVLWGSLLMKTLAAPRPPQEPFRTVFIAPQGRMHPVTIEKVTVRDQVIQLGIKALTWRDEQPATQFQSDKNWLKNMSIFLKNRTDKTIVCAVIGLWFPETGDGRTQAVTHYYIDLGQLPEIDSFTKTGQKIPPDPNSQPLLFAPGKTLVIHVADYITATQDTLEQFPGLLAAVNKPPLSQITKVVIAPKKFFFDDGMRWTDLEEFGVPDPNQPGQFTNMERGRYFPGDPWRNSSPSNAPFQP